MPTANTIAKEDVKLYVAALAQQHGVVYSKTGNDALAEIITRLGRRRRALRRDGRPAGCAQTGQCD